MSTIPERLEVATASVEADSTKLHAIVNGAADAADVVTEGGNVKVIAKVVAEGEAAIGALEETATASKDTAVAAAATATTQAGTATTQAGIATTKAADAETARAAAVVAKTAAEAAQTAAAASETAAGNSATTAGTGATTATTKAAEAVVSAAAALVSQNAAAASAATAAGIAGFTGFKGTQAGASVPATSTNSGDAYLITSAGTSQSKTWAVNDLAIYNGSSGSWTQVAAAVWVGVGQQMVNSRCVSDSYNFDGTASGGKIWWAMGAVAVFGAGDFTHSLIVEFPTAAISVARGVAWLGTSNSNASATSPDAAWNLRVGATNQLILQAISSSDYTQMTVSIAAYLGKTVLITWGRNAGVPFVYFDGVALTLGGTTTGGAGYPFASAITPTYLGVGNGITQSTDIWAGRIRPLALVNAALTAAEILDLALTGRHPTWCELGTGSMVNKNGDVALNDIAKWGSASTITRSVTGGVMTLTNAIQYASITALVSGGHKQFTPGARIRYRIVVDSVSGTGSPLWTLQQANNVEPANTLFISTPGTKTGSFIAKQNDSSTLAFNIKYYGTGSAGAITISSIELIEEGCVIKPVIQPIPVVADASANKIAGILTAGVAPITDKRDWVIQGKTSTSGNQQLLGTSVFFDYLKHMLDSIETNGASTATVSIGNVSAGAQYKASAAIASGRNRHSLVTPIPLTNNIWVASSTTDELTHTVRGHLVD